MNRLLDVVRLDNRYIAVRHGHSEANLRGLVVSDPANGCAAYGLSPEGRREVESAARLASFDATGTVIVSSDFRRALDTAEILRRELAIGHEIEIDERLRERHFGDFELGPNDVYEQVWRADARDGDARPGNAESVNQVMARVSTLVVELERRYRAHTLLLVSHGDTLQILETAFARRPASSHREAMHLETAEIRPLVLSR